MAEEREPAVDKSRKADAFLIDRVKVSPEKFRELLAEHTKGWPARHCIRPQAYDGRMWTYVTPTPECTLLFVHGHKQAKQPRYEWKDLGEGVRAGYLTDEREKKEQAERVEGRKAAGF